MSKTDFTAEENALIQHEFELLLDDYAHTLHRQKVELITRAFHFANQAHYGVRRLSGEPYIMHPLAVARIVVREIGLGSTSICSALLHDVVEDTEYTTEDIRNMFGDKIAQIVDGLTKISGGVFGEKASVQAENFRKLLLTMSDDIRVVLVKIADRLHNMRTLGAQPKEKQYKIAGETLYIYAPLAHRLGLFPIKSELEDLSFRYEHPDTYEEIRRKIAENQDARMETFEQFAIPIRKKLTAMGYQFTLTARIKSIYSVWQKMNMKNIPFEDIYDLLAVRIVFTPQDSLSEKDQCWMIYSAITEIYRPHPERIRDWISTPKANGYEALHVTVMGNDGEWIEVQIRTDRMHEIAERGLAAHWKYKAGESDESELDKWLRDIKEILAHPSSNAVEFLGTFKLNLFAHEVFVFTPSGEIKTLPQGATALDLAFNLHSELGEHCMGAKVNHNLVPLSYVLQSGDQVEILTSNSQHPQKEWLDFVVTAKAQSGLHSYFKREERNMIRLGEKLLNEALERIHYSGTYDAALQRTLNYYDLTQPQQLYLQIGEGAISLEGLQHIIVPKRSLLSYLNPFYSGDKTVAPKEAAGHESTPTRLKKGEVIVLTDENLGSQYHLAECCRPIPGDEVLAYTDEQGVTFIHKIDCETAQLLKSSQGKRIHAARWSTNRVQSFVETIEIRGVDKFGLFVQILNIITTQFHINIHEMHVTADDGIFDAQLRLYVYDRNELQALFLALKKIPEIKNVQRITK
ncbi:MAG: bifunctional (p)ppGpp synthetase/guanosine-3',5'-bis(diphosphate) 3'-pyrophosphohydrolase [Paludibacteraceae bacterium]|nr:bifunctional (p)ppGpp synthetase/guanosine-3',5'-bis(diphosphate) 3'-pyrophosphohydrolase [Paludibacteraceae bacterium]